MKGCDKTKGTLKITLKINPEILEEYDRSLYQGAGDISGWADFNNDCQNTRAEILGYTSLIPPVLSANGCKVDMGLWYDPYSGIMYEDPSILDIDHIVPIKEAHESGAIYWSSEKKHQFANDFEVSNNLIPVWRSLNRSKGAKEPYEWMPPNINYKCDYLYRWIQVKKIWDLNVDRRECNYIVDSLQNCQ